ncbi:MAG: protein phosphatase 2C domain-containing protein [Erysipelotrichaceae bacterium]|nr:protein phosphatase 2C domain-containing protein [Erysipelotrichaceae bacterium]
MTRINSINLTGTAHAIDHKDCEDALFIHDQPVVCCVADGVSHSMYGGVGAQALVQGMGKYLIRNGVITHYNSMTCEEIRDDFAEKFRQLIARLIKQEPSATENDFSSTFLACFYEGNVLTIIHAGDGAVIGLPHTDAMVAPVILSYPDNNAQDQVYQAAHRETSKRMRVIRVNKDDFSAICLGTDGFTNAYLEPSYQGYDPNSMKEVFTADDQELKSIVDNNHLREHMITDDITAVIIHLHTVPELTHTKVRNFTYQTDTIQQPITRAIEETSLTQEDTKVDVQTEKDKRKKGHPKLKAFIRFLTVVLLLGAIGANGFQYYRYTQIQAQLKAQKETNRQLQKDYREVNDELDKLIEEIESATEKSKKTKTKKAD